MSGMGGLAGALVGLAFGGVGYELARAGDLGAGLKGLADQIDTALGITATTPGSTAKTGKPSTVETVNTTGATVYCKDGTARTRTWDQIDSELKGAQNPMTSHDKAEAAIYAQTCTGA